MLRIVWFMLFALVSLSLCAAAEGPKKPNVIIVLTDDMGYADVGCYGAKDIRTPHIDRLAREGVRMTDFYSNGPVCTPTRCGLMTGRWQQRVGLEWAIGVTSQPLVKDGDTWRTETNYRLAGLDPIETSLARMLKSAGYSTACYGKWHLGYDPRYSATAHGFDEFFGILGGNADMYSHLYRDGSNDLYEKTEPTKVEGYLTDRITDRAVQYIEQQGKQNPYFLYVPYNAVHWPFQPPNRPDTTRTYDTWYAGSRDDYAKMLEAVDTGVGRIYAALEKSGTLDNTLFIFTNDNGGEVRLANNAPLFHHKATLWEGGIRVPCVLRWPGKLPQGVSNAQVGISMDLTATILAATGVEPPSDRKLDGVNLLPQLQGLAANVDRTLYWRIDRLDRKQKAIRHGKWKLVLDGSNAVTSLDLLFDLSNDISERTNLAYRHPEVVAQLRKLLADWEGDLAQHQPKMLLK